MAEMYSKIKTIIFSIFIRFFKLVVPFSDGVCKYEPSCSAYAIEAIKVLPLHVALPKIVYRFLKCNPLSRGGYDPVKPERTVL